MSLFPAGKEYASFLQEIKKRISDAQYAALKSVNKELISLYWDLGKGIVEKQHKFGWGKGIVENLSKDLQIEFVGIKGFSPQNLWFMRQFYVHYSEKVKLQPLVREISWVKNIIILSKCKDDLEREFYLKMTSKYGWTKNVLIHQIENKSYEKFLLNQTNFDITVPQKYRSQAKLAVKDEYTFDFLELGEEHSERELENALINKIKRFLNEMGGYFCFIGTQYRVEVDGEEYFIDLVLYHRKLRCLMAIELKIGKFKPEYAGKMQFYLSALDDTVRLEDENPSIGIIISKEKSRTTVEYALRDVKKPIGISTYKITPKLPKNLLKYLPSAEDITRRLKKL
ncbi:MAG TPA: PDDEXK nuclease domain-containing protein [Candidatus Nanoarchaeia archaeon]|nr:PDDEXK nuclease domain-containing protein [Candidatus Nanoarchaeia archaeon]